jgi:hypothetical protein
MSEIQHDFSYSVPEGQEYVTFGTWIRALPEPERSNGLDAIRRQLEIRQHYVDAGLMKVVIDPAGKKDPSYIWSNEEAATNNKPNDPEWELFWNRWIKEYNITFNVEKKQI